MNKSQVIHLIEEHQNARGIEHWNRYEIAKELKGYGIGLTQLRKMAKQIGRNHELALQLWETPIYEAKVLATLIEEPKKIPREQAEKQVGETNFWMLSHAYCSCNGALAKVPYVIDLVVDWSKSKNHCLRRGAYLLLYDLAKNKRKQELTDAFFLHYLNIIEAQLQSEENYVKDAMNNALMNIGMRNRVLHQRALEIAKKIGKVNVYYGENSCEAMNVVKHLTSDRVMKKIS